MSGVRMARRGWWLVALAAVILVVVVLTPLASPAPDGLERVAADAGFAERGEEATLAVLPDYSMPLLGDGDASVIVAGLLGVVVIFGLTWLLGRHLARRHRAAG